MQRQRSKTSRDSNTAAVTSLPRSSSRAGTTVPLVRRAHHCRVGEAPSATWSVLLGVIVFVAVSSHVIVMERRQRLLRLLIQQQHLQQQQQQQQQQHHDTTLSLFTTSTTTLFHKQYPFLKDPQSQLEHFLDFYPKTPGTYFVQLLQTNLYNSPTDEWERLQACQTIPRTQQLKHAGKCFAGLKAHNEAVQTLQTMLQNPSFNTSNEMKRVFLSTVSSSSSSFNNKSPISPLVRLVSNTTLMEQLTQMKVTIPDTGTVTSKDNTSTTTTNWISVYNMRRYGPNPKEPIGRYSNNKLKNNTHSSIQHQIIPNLGTPMACLPLILAGTAVSMSVTNTIVAKLIAELGPYFGLSSKCLATGLAYTSAIAPGAAAEVLYVAYDTFAGQKNLQSLQHSIQTQSLWDDYFADTSTSTTKITSTATKTRISFLFLWERAVLPVYAAAKTVVGKLQYPQTPTIYQLSQQQQQQQQQHYNDNERTVQEELQQQQRTMPSLLSLVVLDSAKTAQAWNEQLKSVLGDRPYLPAGCILFLMDFQYVSIQIKQIYGCLRSSSLLPVYISWNQEHWAFIATDRIELTTMAHQNCYATIATHVEKQQQQQQGGSNGTTVPRLLQQMKNQVQMDLEFVSHGLVQRSNNNTKTNNNNNNHHDDEETIMEQEQTTAWTTVRYQLQQQIIRALHEKPEQWSLLAELQ